MQARAGFQRAQQQQSAAKGEQQDQSQLVDQREDHVSADLPSLGNHLHWRRQPSSGIQISAVAITCSTPATRNEVPSNARSARDINPNEYTSGSTAVEYTQPRSPQGMLGGVVPVSHLLLPASRRLRLAGRSGMVAKQKPLCLQLSDQRIKRRPERILARPDARCAIRMSPSRRLPTARLSRVSLEKVSLGSSSPRKPASAQPVGPAAASPVVEQARRGLAPVLARYRQSRDRSARESGFRTCQFQRKRQRGRAVGRLWLSCPKGCS